MNEGKILVAGASGRVGGAAVEGLLEAGFEVRALVRRAEKGERLRVLGAELVVGDVAEPRTLVPAAEGCSGILSALGAGPGRRASEAIEYEGNLNLLSTARSAGVRRFVYSSALLADHPLAQKVGSLREKARFERKLLAAEDVSYHPAPGDIHGDPPHDAPRLGRVRLRSPTTARLLGRCPRHSPGGGASL